MTKTIGIWIGVFVATFAVLFVLIKYTAPADPAKVYPQTTAIRTSDHVRGNASAPALLVEYGDFQCPGCAGFEPLLQKLSQELGDRMALVYRHFPLPGHPHAITAVRFAESAGLQGKFWEMHDKIFAEQKAWSGLDDAAPTFVQYGKDLGLDVDRLQRDLESEAVLTRVSESQDEARALGLNSTPTFFLNGKIIHPSSYDELKALVESAQTP